MVEHGNRGKAHVPARTGRRRPPPSLLTLAGAGLAAVALLGAGLAGYSWFTTPPSSNLPTFDRTAAEQKADVERDARNARVCDVARGRVLHGATLGVTETDGWVVEVMGLRTGATAPPAEDPALRAFVAEPSAAEGSSFIWKEEPLALTVPSSFARVTISS